MHNQIGTRYMPRYGTKFIGHSSNSDDGRRYSDDGGGGGSKGLLLMGERGRERERDAAEASGNGADGGNGSDGASNLKSTKINFASKRCQNVHFHTR